MSQFSSGRFGKPVIPPGRMVQLAESHSAAEIADKLGIDEEEVLKALEASGKKLPRLLLRCLRSNRTWPVRSERGAYRLAQLKGLTTYQVEAQTAEGKKS